MPLTDAHPALARETDRLWWVETAAPGLEARLATQFALANGTLGLRGTHEEMPAWASPGLYLAGSYCAAPRALVPLHTPDHILAHPERIKPDHHAAHATLNTLPNLPNPVAVRLAVDGTLIDLDAVTILACERVLEMAEARLRRRLVLRDTGGRRVVVDSERFVSWANPHLIGFRYAATVDEDAAPASVEPYIDTTVANARGFRLFTVIDEYDAPNLRCVTVRTTDPAREITIAQASRVENGVLEALIAVHPDARAAERLATEALAAGFQAAKAAHLAAVGVAMARSRLEIGADALARQGMQFGRLQLEMALCRDNPRVSVPIKGLTGEGYRFMVFWDTDYHMFPYYLLTDPAQAQHLIRYRYHLLDAARANARAWGYRGAQVPWETGASGAEETAPWLCLQERELHISADAAYMVKLYDDLSGDPNLLIECGAEIVFETARFFASRATRRHDRWEILDIGCPDQYHTFADNNVFINRMAQWNLAYAAELAGDARLDAVKAKIGLADAEAAHFRAMATEFFVPAPNAEGIIEEFDGFFRLSTEMEGISESYCAHTQAVKQPDVLLLFQPFGDEYSEKVQRANWHYYAARTRHGSSLSLPGMALAGAKAGLLDEAMDYFARAARMDLDDVNLNTAIGVHLTTYAVLWQAAVFGFGGLTPRRDRLDLRPQLPRAWSRLTFAAHWRGCRFEVELTHESLRLIADPANPRPLPFRLRDTDLMLDPGEECSLGLA